MSNAEEVEAGPVLQRESPRFKRPLVTNDTSYRNLNSNDCRTFTARPLCINRNGHLCRFIHPAYCSGSVTPRRAIVGVQPRFGSLLPAACCLNEAPPSSPSSNPSSPLPFGYLRPTRRQSPASIRAPQAGHLQKSRRQQPYPWPSSPIDLPPRPPCVVD